MVKIAVASTDGKVVNQHFGRSDKFYILETNEQDGTYRLIEERETKPICHAADHEDNQLKQAVRHLSDCQYVLVSCVGVRARNELEQSGIEIYEIPGIIGESVVKLVNYIKVSKLL